MSDQPRGFQEPLMSLFNDGIRYASFIDVGCADAGFFLWGHSAGFFKTAKPYLIDMNPIYNLSLEMIKRKLGGDFKITAISDIDGEIPFIIAENPMWSSARDEKDLYWDRVCGVAGNKNLVPCRTLDSLSVEFNSAPPYFLKLDVQGSELAALKGGAKLLNDTHVILCECDISDFASINHFLFEKKFHLYDITCMNFVEKDKLGWFYAVYISDSINHVLPKRFIPENALSTTMKLHQENRILTIQANRNYLSQFRDV